MVTGVQVMGGSRPGYSSILTDGALEMLAALHRTFDNRRLELLERRVKRQAELDKGFLPDFLSATGWVRNDKMWRGPPVPHDLEDRRVEITGPVDRKMVINALNSGAKVFMADFEDAHCPTWHNNVDGQMNLRDAVRKTISFTDTKKNKTYSLKSKIATLMVRPRGWHLNEAHFLVDGQEMSASMFDFGLYFYHNAKYLLANGSGPYFYLPKMESHLEARLWNDVFNFAQDWCQVPRGSVRATCLLETIMAAFEMEEIIYELRTHSAGLNCGRWDYIFSTMKRFACSEHFTFPDRGQVGMDRPFMDAYVRNLIKVCHRRGVHAMGGMSAFIPLKGNEERNKIANEKVRKDKAKEALAGHDGSWVAHPALVPIATEVYDRYMPTPNQINKQRDDVVTAAELLDIGDKGTITESGLRQNIIVPMAYMEAWLRGVGCIPWNGLMEDAATAEISRTQVWQWIRNAAVITKTGQKINKALVASIVEEELMKQKHKMGEVHFEKSKFNLASSLLMKMLMKDTLDEFLTTQCYPWICSFKSQV